MSQLKTMRGQKKKKKEMQESRQLQSNFSIEDYLCRLIIDGSSRESFTCTRFMQDGLAQRHNTNGIQFFLRETFARKGENCLLLHDWFTTSQIESPPAVPTLLSPGSHASVCIWSIMCFSEQ